MGSKSSSKKKLTAPKELLRTAHQSRDIDSEVFERLMEVVSDGRKEESPLDLLETVLETTAPTPLPPPPEDCVLVEKTGIDTSEAELTPDAATSTTEAVQATDHEMGHVVKISSHCVPEHGDAEYEHEERCDEEEEHEVASSLFLWCRGCRNLFAFVSNERNLPCQVVPATKAKDAVVLFLCATCKKKKGLGGVAKARSGFGGWDMHEDEGTEAKVAAIDIHPEAWEGTEGCKAASAMVRREVKMLGDENEQTACVDGLKTLQSMRLGEEVGSVDLLQFQKGVTGMSLLGLLRGGFI